MLPHFKITSGFTPISNPLLDAALPVEVRTLRLSAPLSASPTLLTSGAPDIVRWPSAQFAVAPPLTSRSIRSAASRNVSSPLQKAKRT